MKKRILGTLFGFLALFGFGAIYYGILTADAAAEMMAQYEGCLHAPKMSLIVLGNILASYLLVYVFDEMGVNDAKSGAYQGAMIMAIVFGIFQAFATAQLPSMMDHSPLLNGSSVSSMASSAEQPSALTIQNWRNSACSSKKVGPLGPAFLLHPIVAIPRYF